MSKENSRGRTKRASGGEAEDILKSYITERVTEKMNQKVAKHAEKLDSLVPVIDVWTRREPGARKPRYSRDDIAQAAVRIADTEGIEALSMRRLATELGAGTMTLYHYIRTKDELLSLVSDAVMGEIILPPAKLKGTWRQRITAIAHSSRAVLERHPWIFDVVDDPAVGPNGVRHFDQSWEAVDEYPGTFEDKMDLIASVDEYVFGYVMHARHEQDHHGHAAEDPMRDYVHDLLGTGGYPTLARLANEHGFDDLWRTIDAHGRDLRRFDRNLNRLLDGFSK